MDSKANTNGSLALQENKRRVITIEATKAQQAAKLRVAAYTRVSSSSEDQLNSYGAQNRYYTEYITSHEQWTLVDIYADEGITGTSTEKREDFQRLLADCRRGKIDMVITKSISRFARNTKECLEAVRELKSHGIRVCFEEQKIDTAAMSSEMITAIFASIAQRESETISQNLRWSYQKRMESGSFITCNPPFGYILSGNRLEIKEDEAKIVRKIFNLYLDGKSLEYIAEQLTTMSIPTKSGSMHWQQTGVSYIIKNEIYIGNALLQKKYSTNDFPHLKKRNKGEKPQYYVVSVAPPIIGEDIFKKAQRIIHARASIIAKPCKEDLPFKYKIKCGRCGSGFKKKNSNNIDYWVCLRHDVEPQGCAVKQIPQKVFEESFCRLNYKLKHHPEILTQMVSNLQAIRNHRMLWSIDVIELNKRISEITSQAQMLTVLKQQGLVDPDIFISKSNELTEQLRKTKLEKERLLDNEQDEVLRQTEELIEILEHEPDFIDGFDEELFGELIDKIIVESNDRLVFRLKNGLELAESIERTVR